jgi:hypothetical protein
MPRTDQNVRVALSAAIDNLMRVDNYLLAADCSERSITHQLAVHLAMIFPNYHVDCEYNRDGFDVKRLQLPERQVHVTDDQNDAVTVFPDIVVHKRGTDESNLLVVEIKKAASSVDRAYDIQKLRAFKKQLKYAHAAHVILGYSRDGKKVTEIAWQ